MATLPLRKTHSFPLLLAAAALFITGLSSPLTAQSRSLVLDQSHFSANTFSNTGSLGVNIPRGRGASTGLDIWLNTTDAALRERSGYSTAKFTDGLRSGNSSYIHYGQHGDWVIQSSSENSGVIYVQPRGGTLYLGRDLVSATDPTKRATGGTATTLRNYATSTTFYNNVYIYNPSAPTDDGQRHPLHGRLKALLRAHDQHSFMRSRTQSQEGGRYNTGLFGINVTPNSVLTIESHPSGSATPIPGARFLREEEDDTPSYIHHLHTGNWIIQSVDSSQGSVYLQPRGGTVQIGSSLLPERSDSSTRILSKLNNTQFDIYAPDTHIYGTLVLHHESTTYNTLERLSRIVSRTEIFDALGFRATNNIQAQVFRDFSPTVNGYGLRPSGESKLNTVNVSIMRDNQSADYKLDPHDTSIFNRIAINGQSTLGSVTLKRGDVRYTLSLLPSIHTMNLNGNQPSDRYDFVINRPLVLGADAANKLNFDGISPNSYNHGIYFNNTHLALSIYPQAYTTFSRPIPSMSRRLYINYNNNFQKVHIGSSLQTSTYLEVNGDIEVDVDTHVQGAVTITDDLFVTRNLKTAPSSGRNIQARGRLIGDGTIPIGGIIMWRGTTPPDGWALCDGNDGRPDLKNRFIIGASKNRHGRYYDGWNRYNRLARSTGGNESISLGASHLPRHSHYGFGESGRGLFGAYSPGHRVMGSRGGEDGDNYQFYTSETGRGSSFDIYPSYYVLAYIIRVR